MPQNNRRLPSFKNGLFLLKILYRVAKRRGGPIAFYYLFCDKQLEEGVLKDKKTNKRGGGWGGEIVIAAKQNNRSSPKALIV